MGLPLRYVSETRTESTIVDLLTIQGWSTKRPPKGSVLRQNEYRGYPAIDSLFKSKSGAGRGYPDFVVIDEDTTRPRMVIEAKGRASELPEAMHEAKFYGEACLNAGHSVVVVGIAGQEETGVSIGVSKYYDGRWQDIIHEGNPVSWIPTPKDLARLLADGPLLDLAPEVPNAEILAKKADLLNRILREATIKDEFRPAYIGAMMLALWQSKGSLRRQPDFVLRDINSACGDAFANSGKVDLARSLRVDEANVTLANNAWRILTELEKLNVVSASFDHDYLGQLYETFFRYTGGNTIGQYFTPRHITRLMVDLCETTSSDVIIDVACGTGGFLIAALNRAYETSGLRYEDVVNIVRHNLIGYESEPITAALCVANMILRGDGKTGIRKANSLTATDYPIGQCQVALLNPPFPHKKTDTPSTVFVNRALEALQPRGRLAVLLPSSILVKSSFQEWRNGLLRNNSLVAVCQLPDELFQPFASATTSILVIEKGVPHTQGKKTAFARIHYDGLTLKKGTRVNRADGQDQLPDAVDALLNRKEQPGFSGTAPVLGKKEWAPGAYIPSGVPSDDELRSSIDELLRRHASFYTRYAAEIAVLRERIADDDLTVNPYREFLSELRLNNAAALPAETGTIGELFDIYYGQKELHSRDGIPPGDSLIISPTEQYNGTYGWLTFEPLLKPPFVTVAQTGSIGEAFVQTEACGVNDDCLVLLPKNDKTLSLAQLFIAAAVIRLERWRFSYGRKLTPSRICTFKMSHSVDLHNWVEEQLGLWKTINDAAVRNYADGRGRALTEAANIHND